MSLEAHVVTLRSKHADIDRALHREQTRPLPDTLTIKKLKLEKLYLKEEIERLNPG